MLCQPASTKHQPRAVISQSVSLSSWILLVCLWVLPLYAWEGKSDNKGVELLARMSEQELCQEANAVCLQAAVPGAGMIMEALEYLGSIRQAAQQQTATPAWVTEVATAITNHQPQNCPETLCGQLSSSPREQRAPAPAEPAVPEKQTP